MHEGDIHGGSVNPYHAHFTLIGPENSATHQRASHVHEAAMSSDMHPCLLLPKMHAQVLNLMYSECTHLRNSSPRITFSKTINPITPAAILLPTEALYGKITT
jgi:hypothetical protein